MAKGNNSLTGRRMTSRNPKPYDANNSFVKKVATKVTDLIPQRSWISKWFNTSHGSENALDIEENDDDTDCEEDIQHAPPQKRPRIRMDITHPPGTFCIQPRTKSALNQVDSFKQDYSSHRDVHTEFVKPNMAGSSSDVISSTPVIEANSDDTTQHQSHLTALINRSNSGTNGIDDNSESSESTSGCSSLIPQINRQEVPGVSYSSGFSTRKKFMDDKLNFTNHLQSPRSLFMDTNARDSLSSRKPSFNASIMTASMAGTSPLSSPFYSGNITFGGANAAGLYKRNCSLGQSSQELKLKVPKRMSVEVRPSHPAGVDSSGMSQTAKKILEALEHFSSPITDAKKIPLKSINNSDISQASRKRLRNDASPSTKVGLRHLTRELNVPTVPDILKLRRRQKLQDTTAVARKIVSAHNKPVQHQQYHLRTNADQDSKHPARLKAKSKSKLDQENTIEPVALPNIPLPISSLPTFKFAISHDTNRPDKVDREKGDAYTFASPIEIPSMTKNLKSINNFVFSSPINAEGKKRLDSLSDIQSLKSTSDIQPQLFADDKFPIATKNFNWPVMPVGLKLKENSKSVQKVDDANLSKQKRSCTSHFQSDNTVSTVLQKRNTPVSNVKPNVDSTTGTDIGGVALQKDAVPQNSNSSSRLLGNSSQVWECLECLIKNNNFVSQCVACKATKPSEKGKSFEPPASSIRTEEKKDTTSDIVESKLETSSGTSNRWECTSCYLQNSETSMRCIACDTSKEGTRQTLDTRIRKQPNREFSNEIRTAENVWECSGCAFKNLASSAVCPHCNLSRSFSRVTSDNEKKSVAQTDVTFDKKYLISERKGDTQLTSAGSPNLMHKFKPKADSWECPCCMVRNPAVADTCPCCNTSNPNSSKAAAKKIPAALPSAFGDKFKKPQGAWTCDCCMIQNKSDATECIACTTSKPGIQKSNNDTNNTASNLTFSFGIPPSAGGFKFGIVQQETSANQEIASANSSVTISANQAPIQFGQAPTQITFGIPPAAKNSDTSKSGNIAMVFSTNGTGSSVSQDTISSSNRIEVGQIVERARKEETTVFSASAAKPEDAAISHVEIAAKSSMQNTTGFSFGIPKTKSQGDAGNSGAQTSKANSNIISGSTPLTSTNTELTSNQEKSFMEPMPNSTFTLGSTSGSSTCNTTSTSITSVTTASHSPFTFSESKTTSKSAISQFGQVNTSNITLQSTVPLSCPGNSVTTTTSNILTSTTVTESSTSTQNPLFTSISSPAQLFTASQGKTAPVLGGENKTQGFGESVNKPPVFTAPESKLSSFRAPETNTPLFGTKVPVFGNTEKTALMFPTPVQTNTPTAASGFGSSSGSQSLFDSSTTTFGSNAKFGTEPASNIFSTTKTSENTISSPNVFTFGASAPQLGQPSSGFNFSSNINAPATGQKSLFTFGSNTNPTQSNVFAGTTFNSPASTSGPQLMFNSPKPEATPAFGQPAPSSGIFGALQNNSQSQPTFSTSSSNVGFNFGSAATTPSSGFNFGSTGPAAGSSEGLHFNQGFNFSSSNGTPTFDPNTRPSFNFTGGSAPPTFSAAPQSTRKIKVAVRRKK